MSEGDDVTQDVWERKYHLALERMERDEQDFRKLEEGLRRLVLRLVALARGQSTQADRLLDQLGDDLRHVSSPDTLEPLLDALAEAVTALEPREASAREPGDDTVTLVGATRDVAEDSRADRVAIETLRQVLQRIVLAPTLAGRADELRAALIDAHDTDAVAAAANALADLVNLQRDALKHDIARLQDLLADVSGRLGDMTRYLVAETENMAAADEQGRDLDATVREEMRLLVEQTQGATDLDTLQAQVNARLSLIDEHFRAFRVREDERLATYRDRAARMKDRVEELETQATSLQDSLRREHELALTDPLTGLPNRLAYERRMAEIERDVREHRGVACVGAFDIDHFKVINDSFGHAAGDAVLRIVGQTLTRELPEPAFVARYGGEEFVVVFAGISAEEAVTAAQALCETVAALAFHASQKPVTVTMSGGVTRFLPDDTAATVFDRADRALYAAKRAGRNRCLLL
ncbi:MAG TPA: diguanylate cyclase [Luteibacter sp.]|uniref:GGDEF domain-containing protein n=1 Tax=Luteibacter sp. TaxID=1886636 RepID=UPI002CAF2CA5|nr:diguanylate cyclase [Luteibacter sp.]HVI56769.1 diguanylate cyclase [Luteibacter sp.]